MIGKEFLLKMWSFVKFDYYQNVIRNIKHSIFLFIFNLVVTDFVSRLLILGFFIPIPLKLIS